VFGRRKATKKKPQPRYVQILGQCHIPRMGRQEKHKMTVAPPLLARASFVTARHSMRQQGLDDAYSFVSHRQRFMYTIHVHTPLQGSQTQHTCCCLFTTTVSHQMRGQSLGCIHRKAFAWQQNPITDSHTSDQKRTSLISGDCYFTGVLHVHVAFV